jgi:hypothetical protein
MTVYLRGLLGADPPARPDEDGYLMRVLRGIGQPAGDIFSGPLGPSEDLVAPFTGSPIWPLNAFNRALLQGGGTALDLAWRGLQMIPATIGVIGDETDRALTGNDDNRVSETINGVLQTLPALGVEIPTGMLAPLGRISRAGRLAETDASMASRSARIHNPPVKPPRPFAADYPSGAPADAAGRLAVDIEGRPLTARWVVGRNVVGGEDQALSPAEYDAATQAATGAVPEALAARALPRGSIGAYRVVAGPEGPERAIGFLGSLQPQDAEKVVAHEMGHMIDDLAGAIPAEGIKK